MWDVIDDDKRWKIFLSVYCFALVVVLGIIKAKLGYEVFVLGFFLIPIYLSTWHIGRFMGMVVGIFAALTWLTVLSIMPPPSFPLDVFYWNATAKVGFILISTLFIGFLKLRLDKEKRSARKDPLTNISNRREFFEIAAREINRCQRNNRPFTVACMDVDGFKRINDKIGHKAGDSLLCLISRELMRRLRLTDHVARIGGDEFALLLPETDQMNAKNVLQEVRQLLLREVEHQGFPVTFSIGAATFLNSSESIDDLLKSADDLLYAAKNKGKDRVEHAFIRSTKETAVAA